MRDKQVSQAHTDRVISELRAAGVTSYGLKKQESKYVPQLVHAKEHVMGAVYGQIDHDSAMLLATDKRIIFIDKKPLFKTIDEVSYDVVSGVKMNTAGLFASITLHTRVGDYSLKFVNIKCAQNFVNYIEEKKIDLSGG